MASTGDDTSAANFYARDITDPMMRRILTRPSLYVFYNATYDAHDLADAASLGLHHLGKAGHSAQACDGEILPPFGCGLAAAYLLSSSPIVVSETSALVFDPLYSVRPAPTPTTTAASESTATPDSAALTLTMADPAGRYLHHKLEICRRNFGIQGRNGTLIQIPLTTDIMAQTLGRASPIAVTDLLTSFQTAATPALLFGHAITSLHWMRCSLTAPRSSIAVDKAVPVFSATIDNVDDGLIQKRCSFHIMTPVDTADILRLSIGVTVGDIATSGGKVAIQSHWLVARGYGSERAQQDALDMLSSVGQRTSRACLSDQLSITPVPWCALAVQLGTSSHGLALPDVPIEGRLCRLAPLTTQLSAEEYPALLWHVSAPFATSTAGDLVSDIASVNGRWNRVLLRDVVPVVLTRVLQHLTSENDPLVSHTSLYDLIPSRRHDDTELGQLCDLMVDGFWDHARSAAIVASLAAPQPWFLAKHQLNSAGAALQLGLLLRSRQVTDRELSFPRRPGATIGPPLPRTVRPMWMAPQDVCFLERLDSTSDALGHCLARLGFPVCMMGPPLDDMSMASETGHGGALAQIRVGAELLDEVGFATIITPKLVRTRLCGAPATVLAAALDRNAEDCALLLSYALSDNCEPTELLGFPVPLSDGTTTRFQRCSADGNQILFFSLTPPAIDAFSHGAGHRLIHRVCTMDSVIRFHLNSVPVMSTLNVQRLSLAAMRHVLLPRCLPKRWLASTGIQHVDADATGEKLIPGGSPYMCEPRGWRCVVTDCGQLNPAAVLRCTRPHCPGQSSFAQSALEQLYSHRPTAITNTPSRRPWGELRAWGELQVTSGTSAHIWLNAFWKAMDAWVAQERANEPETAWDDMLAMFEDVALLPGNNGVAYPLGARLPMAAFTPVIWLDRVRRPLNNLLAKLGGCLPDPAVHVPEPVLIKCVNPANGIGCLRVVSWCVSQHEVAEHTFRNATRDERHALLRMMGAMTEYTPAEYRLIAQLPVVEVWDTAIQTGPDIPPESRSFISIAAAVKRKEIFHSDGTANVWMKRGRSRRALVLSRSGPQDQFNAGVVALLQACAESIMRDAARSAKGDLHAGNLSHLADMEIFADDPPTKTLALAQRYRTRCIRDDGFVDNKTFMLKKRPQSAFSQREYPKPWLVGAAVDDDVTTPPTSRRLSSSVGSTTPSPQRDGTTGRTTASSPRRPRTAPPRARSAQRRTSAGQSMRPLSRETLDAHGSQGLSRGHVRELPVLKLDAHKALTIGESWPEVHRLCAQGNPTKVRHSVHGPDQAEAQSAESHWMTPLIVAAGLGHVQVAKLLVLTGASVNKCSSDETQVTPLFVAACNGHLAVCRFLIAYGAKVDAATLHSRATPVSIARANGHTKVVDLLRGSGASAGRPNSSKRKPGTPTTSARTPVSRAAPARTWSGSGSRSSIAS
eukprot:m.122244 g.122244  ORF g.122244 m.122244 type:complete len:1429 (-) comp11102_c0_seq2:2183-6469(-)